MLRLSKHYFVLFTGIFWLLIQTLWAQGSPSGNNIRSSIAEGLNQHRDQPQARVDFLRALLPEANNPETAIINSLLAEEYYHFFIAHLDDITSQPLKEEVQSDLTTWGAMKFKQEAGKAYLQSLQNPELLSGVTGMDDFILQGSLDDLPFRPALYDHLAHRALEFFTDPRCDIKPASPEFRMEIQQKILPPDEFLHTEIPSPDSQSHVFIALGLYQNLLNQYTSRNDTFPLVDTHLSLIRWLRNYASGLDKTGKFAGILNRMIVDFGHHPASAEVRYELALIYTQLAGDFQPLGGEMNKWDYRKAWEICEEAIDFFPKTRGADRCRALKVLIEKPRLRIAAEISHLPEKPFRMQATWKNLDQLHYRILRLSSRQFERLEDLRGNDAKKALIRNYPLIRKGNAYLANDGDFQYHRTEVPMPGLPPGYYAIMAAPREDMEEGLAILAVQVTQLGVLSYRTNAYRDFIFLDKYNGQAMTGLPVAYKTKRNVAGKTKNLITDAEGKVRIPNPENFHETYEMLVWHGEDTLRIENSITVPTSPPSNPRLKTLLFAHQPSYEPASLMDFHGILIRKHDTHNEFVKDTTVAVAIANASMKILDSVVLSTDDYGTFRGRVALPRHIREGKIFLISGSGFAEIKIEPRAYKEFEIRLKPEKDHYLPEDTVTMTGRLVAPPDWNLEDAEVKYLVTRDTRFPEWNDHSWWKPIPNHREVIVKQGSAPHDGNGFFQFKFPARPDRSYLKSQRPVSFFKVRVVAVDPEGERHLVSSNLLVSASGKAVNLEAPEFVDTEDTLKVNLSVSDLKQNPLPFSGRMTIQRILPPDNLYRRRKWEVPDLHLISEDEYRSKFPHDVYGFEDDLRSWALGDTVWNDSLVADMDGFFVEIPVKGWTPGPYRIYFSADDSSGMKIRKRHYLEVRNPESFQPIIPQVLEAFALEDSVFPGDSVRIRLLTSLEKLPVVYGVNHQNRPAGGGLIMLEKSGNTLAFPAESVRRGKLQFSFSAIYHNEIVSREVSVEVPEFRYLTDHISEAEKIQTSIPAGITGLNDFSWKISLDPGVNPFQFHLVEHLSTRVDAASALGWKENLSFPVFSYPHFSPSQYQNGTTTEEEKRFSELSGLVLRLPENQRGLPPPHRWINLFANVQTPDYRTPEWVLKRLKDRNRWLQEKPALPEEQIRIVSFHTKDGRIKEERKTFFPNPEVVILPEIEGEMVNVRVVNPGSRLQKGRLSVGISGQECRQEVSLEPGESRVLTCDSDPAIKSGPDKQIITWEGEEISKTWVEFLWREPMISDDSISSIPFPVGERKMVLPLNNENPLEKSQIQVFDGEAKAVLANLHRIVSGRADRDSDAARRLLAITILDSLIKAVPEYKDWLRNHGASNFPWEDLAIMKQQTEYKLGGFQEKNGVFPNTDEVLRYGFIAREHGFMVSLSYQRMLEHTLRHLDSLYLQVLPRDLILDEARVDYYRIRKGFDNIPVEKSYLNTWRTLHKLISEDEEINKEDFTHPDGPLWAITQNWDLFMEPPARVMSGIKFRQRGQQITLKKKRKEQYWLNISK